MKKKDKRHMGICFGDFELFGAESAAPRTIKIVLAWTDMSGLKATGRQVMRDLNYYPEFIPCLKAHAAIWLNEGTEADIEKAQRHLNTILGDCITGKVFVYPSDEENPLERARKEILINQ